MKALLVLALFATVFAIDINNKVWTNHQQQSLAQIKKSKWGTWILNFSELHLTTKGALSELLDNIHQLIDDLNNELVELNQNFQRRTNEHNREVLRLTQEIQDADREIFNANDFIDNVLIPQRDRLRASLDQLGANIDQNRSNLENETKQRENDHEAYEARVAEHNSALDAIDQSLELLSQLKSPSLAQVKQVQGNLEKIQKSLKHHNTFAPLIRALIELATDSNFADQGSLSQILTAFSNLRNELVESLNQETTDETESQAAFEDRVRQLDSEHAEFQKQVLLKTAELTRTEEKLEATSNFLAQRNIDRNTLQAQLDAENDTFAAETDIYNNLVVEYNKELSASEQALTLLTQDSFTQYVNSKLGAL